MPVFSARALTAIAQSVFMAAGLAHDEAGIVAEHLRPADAFYADVEGLTQYVKSAELAAGFDEILTPGDPEIRTRRQRTRDGIPVDDAAWGQIRAAAHRYGVRLPASE